VLGFAIIVAPGLGLTLAETLLKVLGLPWFAALVWSLTVVEHAPAASPAVSSEPTAQQRRDLQRRRGF